MVYSLTTLLLLLKEFWHWCVIFLLILTSIFYRGLFNSKTNEIEALKLQYEHSLLVQKTDFQEEVIRNNERLIQTTKDVQEVVNSYHEAIEQQNTTTRESYQELQESIPFIVRESCDFGFTWMSTTNSFISASNSTSSTGVNTNDSK